MDSSESVRLGYKNRINHSDFVQVDDWVLFDKILSDGAFRTYAVLKRMTMNNASCWYSQEKIQRARGLKDRAIRNHLTELEKEGLVLVRHGGIGEVNEYFLAEMDDVYGDGNGEATDKSRARCWSPFLVDGRAVKSSRRGPPRRSSKQPNDDSVKAAVSAFSASAKAQEAASKKNKERAEKRMKAQIKKAASKVNASEAKRAADGINTRGMEGIWKNALSDHFPDVTPNRWTGKERKLLKDLMIDHPKETVTRAMVYMCENWDALCRRWKITGVPQIGTLFGYRADIFADIETGGKYTGIRRMDDSYGRVPSTGKGGRDGW